MFELWISRGVNEHDDHERATLPEMFEPLGPVDCRWGAVHHVQVLAKELTMTRERFEKTIPIVKVSPGGYVLAPVLTPDVEDLVGDVVDEESIEEAMVSFAKNGRMIDLNHSKVALDEKDVVVVESYILRADTVFSGVKIRKGTWLLGLLLSPRLRAMVKSGELNGLSMSGSAVRTEV